MVVCASRWFYIKGLITRSRIHYVCVCGGVCWGVLPNVTTRKGHHVVTKLKVYLLVVINPICWEKERMNFSIFVCLKLTAYGVFQLVKRGHATDPPLHLWSKQSVSKKAAHLSIFLILRKELNHMSFKKIRWLQVLLLVVCTQLNDLMYLTLIILFIKYSYPTQTTCTQLYGLTYRLDPKRYYH